MTALPRPGPVILFLQGGGEGTHDDWDDKLVESLRRELGGDVGIRYPRMPDEDDPSLAAWGATIREELVAAGDGVVVVAHSIGATILMQLLAGAPPPVALGALLLVAAPFVGRGGWPAEDGEALPADLGARLPAGVPVHLFHGDADDTAPRSHADRYAEAIPHAVVRRLPGRDHQLNDDLSEVAEVIRTMPGSGTLPEETGSPISRPDGR